MSNFKKYMPFIGIIFSIVIFIFTLNEIQLYLDDFYYKSFLEGGFENFINLNIEHYKEVNGRVLVHILDEIMLNMNLYIYITFIVLCLTYDFYFVGKFLLIKTKAFSKQNILYSVCVSWLLLLLVDVYVLKETVFWITGAFNYIFPITMSLLALSTVKKALDKNKTNLLQILLIFIAAATTEQGFIVTFLLTIGYSIIHNFDKKVVLDKKELLFFIIEILGFLTIFLSPASRLRATNTKTIFNSSIIELLELNFETFATRIVGENSIFIIISFLMISIALLALREKRLSKILLSGFFIGSMIIIVNILGTFSGTTSIIMTVSIILFIIFSIIELFKYRRYRNISLILCVAFLLQGGTFLLGESSYRTLFILSLFCLTCTSNIFTIIMNLNKKDVISIGLIMLLIILGTVHMVPIINGYRYNKTIFDDMKKSIEDYEINGYVEIKTNIDYRYAYNMGYSNGFIYDYFLKHYGIKDIEDDVYFVNDEDTEIFVNGKRIRYPAWFKDDEVFVPMRYIVEALSGKCEWTKDKTVYSFDNYFVEINNYSNKISNCSNEEYINTDLSYIKESYMNRSYINIEFLKYIIGENENNIKIGGNIYNYIGNN